jgi:hypothetical protein
MAATLKVHCDVCAGVRAFEQPTCVESHDGECPDWACTTCGSAIFLAPAVILVRREARATTKRAA